MISRNRKYSSFVYFIMTTSSLQEKTGIYALPTSFLSSDPLLPLDDVFAAAAHRHPVPQRQDPSAAAFKPLLHIHFPGRQAPISEQHEAEDDAEPDGAQQLTEGRPGTQGQTGPQVHVDASFKEPTARAQ
jgi:hypothetical protein